MQRAGNLVLIVLGLLLAGGLALFFLTRSGPAVPDSGATTPGDRSDSGAAPATVEAKPSDARRADVTPRTLVESAAQKAEADPELEKHLAGFTGRIVTQDAKAAPGCAVRMYVIDPAAVMRCMQRPFEEELADLAIDLGSTKTDPDGRFTLRGASPRAYFGLVAGDGVDTPVTFELIHRTPSPGELVDLGDIALRDAVTVTGRIVDPNDKPVVGALVRAVDLPGALLGMAPVERFDPEGFVIMRGAGASKGSVLRLPGWIKRRFDELPLPRTTSDAEGKFKLVGVDVGTNTLAITAAGLTSFLNGALRTKSGQDKDLGVIKLKEGETAVGRVVDGFGKDVAGAEVLIAQTSTAMPVDFAGKPVIADERGRFEQKGFAPGSVTIGARRGPRDAWTIQDPAPVGSDQVVRLPALATLTVRLSSKEGAALEQTKLRLVAMPSERELAFAGFATPVALDGRSEQLAPELTRIRDLPVGGYLLFATAKGHADSALEINLERDQETALVLHRELRVMVRVLAPDDRPLRSASVYARFELEAAAQGPAAAGMPLPVGTTGAAGRVEAVIPADAKSVTVSATHPAYGVVHEQATLPVTEVTLRMLAPGAVEGVLTDKGKPPKPGQWVVEIGVAWSESGRGNGALPDLERIVVPDAEGRFSMQGLRPGKYQATATKALGAVRSPGAFYDRIIKQGFMFWMDRNSTEFTVESGKTAMVAVDTEAKPGVVDGPAARVTGVVTIDGVAAEGMKLFGWGGQQQVRGTVDAAGRFDLGRVHAGSLWLQLVEPNSTNPWEQQLWSGQVQVVADTDRELQIHLRFGTIEGIVYGSDGQTAANVEVRCNGTLAEAGANPHERGGTNLQGRTDDQGRFRFERAPAATYHLQANDTKRGRSTKSGVVVKPGSPTTTELRMHRTYSLSGKVDLAPLGERQANWIWVHFQLEEPKATEPGGEGVQIQADGSFKIEALVPGTYTAHVYFENEQWHGLEKVRLGNEDLADVRVSIEKEKPIPPVRETAKEAEGGKEEKK